MPSEPRPAVTTERPSPPTARDAPHRRYLPTSTPRPIAWAGLYPGEPEAARRDLRKFLPIWAHLALLVAVIKVYRIDPNRSLFLLSALATVALPIHYLLPYRWKKPAFLATSVLGLFLVFGPLPALAVAAVASSLIGVCRLPIAWWARATIVGSVGLALGIVRALTASRGHELADVALPVLGSMLMFRMILYLYEIKHIKGREPLVDSFGYFFLLPNFCFTLFPVVDYRTMGRSYFAADIHTTQLTGLRMMFQGLVHLLAYRLVYHELLIRSGDVHNVATLLAYVACNYLLYLQVSGQFHVACGMLHLFGYQLPPTHNKYFLATGFTDYWRRINIYWKDFMIRVVFNPVAFRLKRRPRWVCLGVATTAVFAATWLLHGYQMFWLRGTWGFSVPDALFWGILGGLVLINVQLDARETADRRPSSGIRSVLIRSIKAAATFSTIALLWSLWSAPSVAAWLAMFGRAFAG